MKTAGRGAAGVAAAAVATARRGGGGRGGYGAWGRRRRGGRGGGGFGAVRRSDRYYTPAHQAFTAGGSIGSAWPLIFSAASIQKKRTRELDSLYALRHR